MSIILATVVILGLLVGFGATVTAISNPSLRVLASVVAFLGFGAAAACIAFFVAVVARM